MSLIRLSDAHDAPGIHLPVLMRTHLLLTANSGGGKSWALRRLAEQLFGKVPVVIVDPDGEFATLREKFGFVLAGPGGETIADPRYAAKLAHRLLELRASAVIDLYELKVPQRHMFVQLFLDAMVDAPKTLWHDTVVIVDEAHVFMPEKGEGESVAAEAMVSMATRGRKRGFCSVFATQRLSKIRKSGAAELQNVLVGSTFLDNDQDRACDVLGVSRADRERIRHELKVLEPGSFFALGRAISKDRVALKVGRVATTHPEPGSSKHAASPPPSPASIKKLLPQLTDLPAEAEEEARTAAELQEKIRALRAELAEAKKVPAVLREWRKEPTPPKTVVKSLLTKAEERRLISLGSRISDTAAKLDRLGAAVADDINRFESAQNKLLLERTALEKAAEKLQAPERVVIAAGRPMTPADLKAGFDATIEASRGPHSTPTPMHPSLISRPVSSRIEPAPSNGHSELSASERKILTALAQYPEGLSKDRLAILTVYTASAGRFNNLLGALRAREAISGAREEPIRILPAGVTMLGSFTPLPTGPALVDYWLGRLDRSSRLVLEAALSFHGRLVDKQAIADRISEITGGQVTYEVSAGRFNNLVGRLRTMGLLVGRGGVAASPHLVTGETT